jgi:uncharacterized phage protein (TIGR02218 family)
MRVFFKRELDNAATFWRVFRNDGIALGFTSHDRDLTFGGIRHRAAPGMVPTAIRLTSDLTEDSAGVEGALNHRTIREADLAAGLFDGAAIQIGIVDWITQEHQVLYSGSMGRIEDDTRGFTAELRSAKQVLEHDLVPRTSPTCRAEFCGPGCGLSAMRFTTRVRLNAVDFDLNRVSLEGADAGAHVDGRVRFIDGPQTGIAFGVISVTGSWLTLDRPIDPRTLVGTPVELREGCDHTIDTCAGRFANAVNFRGEPFLPGNDLLARYGQSSG